MQNYLLKLSKKCLMRVNGQKFTPQLKQEAYGATALTRATMGVQKIFCHMALGTITKK